MAYATSDVFSLITPASLAVGPRIFFHASADALAAANGAGFITDGTAKGLRVGDYVMHRDSTSAVTDTSLHMVVTVSATYPGAVDLSDGTLICAGAVGD